MKNLSIVLVLIVLASAAAKKKNVILIVTDDHRYDFMSFMPEAPSFLETPNMDQMAKGGIHLKNAFVTTSLCSPSRASILTGQYMHHHKVVDNQRKVPEGTVFFPKYLQAAKYQTAFIGKWHMGHDNDEARPGYHHWVSFKGQGKYFDPELNINGKRKKFKGYNADILTDQAVAWIETAKKKPFFLHLSYKAVHYPFQPPKRFAKLYENERVVYPSTMGMTERNNQTQSKWMKDRRYGIHGIEHMETGHFDKDPVPSFEELYKNFCETVHAVDENIGRVLAYLKKNSLTENTVILYMGDNGFELGEHGFYDKRDAFEESIRIPMLVYAPGYLNPGSVVNQMVQNIDVAATVMEILEVKIPSSAKMDGKSFLPLLKGENPKWRKHILYEYHWEWNFPAVPTTFAIRDARYKYIYYHGIWDRNGFYDLKTDPDERHNLIDIPAFQEKVMEMKNKLFTEFEKSGGLNVPIRPIKGVQYYDRKLPW